MKIDVSTYSPERRKAGEDLKNAFNRAAEVGIPAEAFGGGAAVLFPSAQQDNALRAVQRAVSAAQKHGFEPRVKEAAIIVLDLRDGCRVVPLSCFG
jgi:hypothetical protein